MKKAHLIAVGILVGIIALVSSCSFSKTYSYTVAVLGVGFCAEVTTADADVISALENAGYTEGACSYSAECGTDNVSEGGTTVTVTYYASSSSYCSYI
jgi:hypothetical protein